MDAENKGFNPLIELMINSASTQAMITVAMPLLAELIADKRGIDKAEFVEKMWDKVHEIEKSLTQYRSDAIDKAKSE